MTPSRYVVPACLAALVLAGCDKTTDSAAPAAEQAVSAQAPALASDAQRQGYALGVNVGSQFRQQQIEVDADALAAGVRDAYKGATLAIAEDQLPQHLQQLQQAHQLKMEAQQEKLDAEAQVLGEKNRAEADAFLAQNKSAEGVVTTASGLQYRIDRKGDGAVPKADNTVKVHYRGTLRDGTEFDSSYARGEPVSFPVGAVIPGWIEALQLMPVGSKWHLFIPPDLAYGPGGAGGKIGPNVMLEFDVELLGIEPVGTEAAQ